MRKVQTLDLAIFEAMTLTTTTTDMTDCFMRRECQNYRSKGQSSWQLSFLARPQLSRRGNQQQQAMLGSLEHGQGDQNYFSNSVPSTRYGIVDQFDTRMRWIRGEQCFGQANYICLASAPACLFASPLQADFAKCGINSVWGWSEVHVYMACVPIPYQRRYKKHVTQHRI